jgi:hypothetical protein
MAKVIQRHQTQLNILHLMFKAPPIVTPDLLFTSLHSSRLIHFCRIPFLFHQRPPQLMRASSGIRGPASLLYYNTGERLVQRSFFQKFRQYLVSVLATLFTATPVLANQPEYMDCTIANP